MNNLKEIFKTSGLFLQEYISQYLKLLSKPIIFGVVGACALGLCALGPIGGVISAFISIPCLCYAFWQGYLITYAINYAADSYVVKQENNIPLIDCYNFTKEKAKELAWFLLFSLIISAVVMIPSALYAINNLNLADIFANAKSVIYLVINSLILYPFYNFLNQAFFYKKDDESFIGLFLNCYKKLDLAGITLVILFSLLPTIISGINSLLYVICVFPLNLIIYFANTIWYKSKTSNVGM